MASRAREAALGVLLLLGAAGCQHDAANSCATFDDCRATVCPSGQLPVCTQGACGCGPDLYPGNIGRFAALQVSGGTAYVCAYNSDYGDLMLGRQAPPGVVSSWEFVDGVPQGAVPTVPGSKVRGGVSDPGDDVGAYCSLAITAVGEAVLADYDATHRALRFSGPGAAGWASYAVDAPGAGGAGPGGDDIGRYTSLTLDRLGRPGIAYTAVVKKGPGGGPEGQVRFAQAQTPMPGAAADWKVTIISSVPLPAAPPADGLPAGAALFVASDRADDVVVIAWYDRLRGNLMYVDTDPQLGTFLAPRILDGEDALGHDTGDVGWYPSVVAEASDDGRVTGRVSYVDAARGQLLYIDTRFTPLAPEVADDGYRPGDETTSDGLPAPTYHLVGDSSSIQLAPEPSAPDVVDALIAYQDATTLQLRLARRDAHTRVWTSSAIAGHGSPFAGSYGFYAQNRVAGNQAILSSYAIDEHHDPARFYVELFGVALSSVIQ